MPIDSSIYNQRSGFLDGVQQGMSLGEMMQGMSRRAKQDKLERGIADAYKSGITQGPDGKVMVNRDATLSALSKVSPEKFMEQQKAYAVEDQQKKDQLFKQKRDQLDLMSRLAGSVTDQGSYNNALKIAQQSGLDISEMPQQYDPSHMKQVQMMALSAKDQLDNHFKAKDQNLAQMKFGLDEKKFSFDKDKSDQDLTARYAQMGLTKDMFDKDYAQKQADLDRKNGLSEKDIALKQQELAQKKELALAEIKNKNGQGNNLPIDKKHFVDTLATKNANKTAIKNQINAVMSGWDNLSDDQKVTAGRQLLKTLNSTEGADAIGAEEAKRLGGKLEFAIGNFTNSNPTQFGRDLKGFKEQALNTSNSIEQSILANQSEIDKAMGRAQPTQVVQQTAPTPRQGDVQEGYVFVGGDPSDPASWKPTSFTAKGK